VRKKILPILFLKEHIFSFSLSLENTNKFTQSRQADKLKKKKRERPRSKKKKDKQVQSIFWGDQVKNFTTLVSFFTLSNFFFFKGRF